MKISTARALATEQCIRENLSDLRATSDWDKLNTSEKMARLVIECGSNFTTLRMYMKAYNISFAD